MLSGVLIWFASSEWCNSTTSKDVIGSLQYCTFCIVVWSIVTAVSTAHSFAAARWRNARPNLSVNETISGIAMWRRSFFKELLSRSLSWLLLQGEEVVASNARCWLFLVKLSTVNGLEDTHHTSDKVKDPRPYSLRVPILDSSRASCTCCLDNQSIWVQIQRGVSVCKIVPDHSAHVND